MSMNDGKEAELPNKFKALRISLMFNSAYLHESLHQLD